MVNDITMENMQPGGMPEDDDMHVVMFYGTTCGPCKATMPHYEATSEFFEERGARIKFHRIDAWNPPEQAKYVKEVWKVEGVPNFKAFFRSQVVEEKKGGGREENLKIFVHNAIDNVYKKFGEKI